MKYSKKLAIIFYTILFLFSVNISYSQLNFYDSISVFSASEVYSYNNPVFENSGNLFYQSMWMGYERHENSSSDIIMRQILYSGLGNETSITGSSNALNINPTFASDILVWQSNARGNWDLYYSIKSNNLWSQAMLLDSSSSNETDPFIFYNGTYPLQFNYYYLVYKRENNIRFKKFKTQLQVWDMDTLITNAQNEFSNPRIIRGSSGSAYNIYYLKKFSNDSGRIVSRIFYHTSLTNVTLNDPVEIYQPLSQNNLSISNSYSSAVTYSYDTLNTRHILAFQADGQNFKEILTKNIPGYHLSGKGTNMNFIEDDFYYKFSTFCSLSNINDSACLYFVYNLSPWTSLPYYKKYYLGDTGISIKYDVSPSLYSGNQYKIFAVWEKELNGRSSLVYSYMRDILSNIIEENNDRVDFSLAQNFPNPFNPKTIINYNCSMFSFISLKVYDALGNEVRTLVNENQNAGSYSITFDGENLASGIYFYTLKISRFKETKKMLLLK